MARRSIVAGAATAAAALALTACGSSGAKSDSATLVAQAAGKTVAAKNAKVAMDIALDGTSNKLTLHGNGVADLQRGIFDVSIQLPAGSRVSGSLDELVIGKIVYLRFPAAMRSQTGGKEWVVIDPSTAAGASSSTNSLSQDLSSYLGALKSAGHNVKVVGHSDVRGVHTTHYQVVIDLAKAGASSLKGSALDQYRQTYGTTLMTQDAYLDDQGIVRRMTMNFTPHSSTASASGLTSETVTMDLYDFGKADTAGITAPAKSDTIDLSKTTLGSTTG
jgi:hypothetical protein